MPARLYFTESDEANKLLATDPMALLVGFALDQQVTVQKAFSGPLVIRERVGSLEPDVLAAADLDAVFREKPAVHRFPGSMAERVSELAAHIRDEYGGHAERVWTTATSSDELRARVSDLPGFGEMKVKSLERCWPSGSASRLHRILCRDTRRSATSIHEALSAYQAAKKAHKAEWSKVRG